MWYSVGERGGKAASYLRRTLAGEVKLGRLDGLTDFLEADGLAEVEGDFRLRLV